MQAEEKAQDLVNQVEEALRAHKVKGEAMKAEAAQERAERRGSPSLASDDKGKGKARALSLMSDDESGSENSDWDDVDVDGLGDSGLPKTIAGKAHHHKGTGLVSRMREAKLLLHRVKFLQGDVFHSLGQKEREDASYGHAEALRRELLSSEFDSIHDFFANI